MPTYRYIGDEPRHPAPPLVVDGELEPGALVISPDPIDDPLFELAEAESESEPLPVEAESEGEPLPVEDKPRRRSARTSQE